MITSGILSDEDEALSSAIQSAFKRVQSMRVPRNWSLSDWFEELTAVGTAAAWQALCDFDPDRGVPLAGFGYCRIISRCLARYRKEWRYALHLVASNSRQEEPTTFERPELNASFTAKLNETHPSNDDLRGPLVDGKVVSCSFRPVYESNLKALVQNLLPNDANHTPLQATGISRTNNPPISPRRMVGSNPPTIAATLRLHSQHP